MSDGELAIFASSAKGRNILISVIAGMEADAASLCRKLPGMPIDPDFVKMVSIHSADEERHANMLREVVGPSAIPVDLTATDQLLAELKPANLGEVYLIVRVLEEFATATYPRVADAFRPWDPKVSATIDSIMVEEVRHLRYCDAVISRYDCAAKLEATRAAMSAMTGNRSIPWAQVIDLTIEQYEPARHLAMIQSWQGVQLDPRALGCGLVIPGVCCGFVDIIGRTSVGYFYGFRANPAVPIRLKAKLCLLLGERVTAAAKEAGLTHGVTTTSRRELAKFWSARGWTASDEYMMQGRL